MASPPSHVQALLPDPSCLKLNSVEPQEAGRVLIAAAAFGSVAYCPACHHASHSLHSRYSRALHDLPWQGATVELRLDVRRFRCRAHDCPRVTFAETLPAVAVKYGRQTTRLSEAVRLIGYVLGGEAGSRLSNRLGIRRVLFTFCNQRTTSPRHQNFLQAAKGIRPLYDILSAAGVKTRRVEQASQP